MQSCGHRDIHAADIEWAPGSEEGVDFARFLLEEGNALAPLVVLSRFAPGAQVPAHTHAANYFEYVIDGEQRVGRTTFRKGDMRLVNGGTGYGPITIGPEGCTVLIVFQQAAGAMMQPRGRARETAGA